MMEYRTIKDIFNMAAFSSLSICLIIGILIIQFYGSEHFYYNVIGTTISFIGVVSFLIIKYIWHVYFS